MVLLTVFWSFCCHWNWNPVLVHAALYSKGGLISTRQLLGAEEVNVIAHSAFKKLFEV